MRSRIMSLLLVNMLFVFSQLAWSATEANLKDLQNPGFQEQPAWFKSSFLDLREDVAEAAEEGRRLLFYFYQDGCPYCKKLITVNFSQKAIIDKTRQYFDVVSINMWGDREVVDINGKVMKEKDFAAQQRVMFTPTLVFFDEKGRVALRLNGYFPPEKFNVALDYVSQKKENTLRFSEYLKQVEPTPSHGKLHAEPYVVHGKNAVTNRKHDYLAVLFEQKECPACDELHKDVLQRAETKDLIKRFDVAQLDMWSRDEIVTPEGKTMMASQWAKALDIKYAPSIVLFDKAGKEIIRMEAYLKSFHVQSVLDYVSSAAYLTEPSFQRYIEKRADAIREQGGEVNLMQ